MLTCGAHRAGGPDLRARQGVLERFSQIKPKVILSVNAVHYNGKIHDHMQKLQQVVAGMGGRRGQGEGVYPLTQGRWLGWGGEERRRVWRQVCPSWSTL